MRAASLASADDGVSFDEAAAKRQLAASKELNGLRDPRARQRLLWLCG
jgi:hypothetical protein